MPQDNEREASEQIAPQERRQFPKSGLSGFVIVGLLLFAGLMILYISNKQPSEALKLLTDNVWNLFILMAICIQAFIYQRQRNIMQGQLDKMSEQQYVIEQQLYQNGIQAHAAMSQWDIMRESLAETRTMVKHNASLVNTAERQLDYMIAIQRAHIMIEGCEASLRGKASCILRIRNSGNTPALNVAIKITIQADEKEPEPKDWGSNAEWSQIGILASGAPITHSDEQFLSPEEYVAVNERQLHLYCYGVIRYRSIFGGKTYYTRFSLIKRDASIAMGPCGKGNDAYEEEDEKPN